MLSNSDFLFFSCKFFWVNQVVHFSLVTQLCLTLCDSMKCSTPGLPQSPPKSMSIESMMPFNHLILCHPLVLCLQSFPASRSFQMSQFFASGGQSIRASASSLVLPRSIKDWFPLGLTGWISFQSKGLSRVFSNTTVQKHQFFGTQPSSQSNSRIHTWLLEQP